MSKIIKKIQSVRGMNDIFPEKTSVWQFVELMLSNVVKSYGYQEIRFPIVEHTELFKRTVGDATDVVEKEMYTFEDRGGEQLSLRPEGTASCVRAGIQHGSFYNKTQRWWYRGPVFRYDRPQKGRYRQFHQFGVEAFGFPGSDIDAEMILMISRIWKVLKLSNHLVFQLNSLGSVNTRVIYRKKLVDYFSKYHEILDTDSKRRLKINPIRILDSKNPYMQDLINNAPMLIDYLDDFSKKHFDQLCELLNAAGLEYEINTKLVRGLDYYSHTVFEWIPKREGGAQSTICGGGRYDPLVAQMGGHETPAIGFALGMERLIKLLEDLELLPKLNVSPDIYFVIIGKEAERDGLFLCEILRDKLPKLIVLMNAGGGNLKKQFRRADQSGATFAFILGTNELKESCVTIKFLRKRVPQVQIRYDKLVEFLMMELFANQI